MNLKKYLKYKNKYINLKKILGGADGVKSNSCPNDPTITTEIKDAFVTNQRDGTNNLEINCLNCNKTYYIKILGETLKFKCSECNCSIYPYTFYNMNRITNPLTIDSTEYKNFILQFERECHSLNTPTEKSINKCKYINNDFIKADIIMNFNINQKQEVLTQENIKRELIKEVDYPIYLCFFISNKGIKFGRIYDVLEYGASHMMLIEQNEKVIIAGEIKCINNDTCEYNFASGSINFKRLREYLIKNGINDKTDSTVGEKLKRLSPYFLLYKTLCDKLLAFYFTNITYTEKDLIIELEKNNLHEQTKKQLCENYYDKQTTYQINYDNDGTSFNRCTQNSLFRMEGNDGKMGYTKLDADITTMKLFMGKDFSNISRHINNSKNFVKVDGDGRKELENKKYRDYLFCKDYKKEE
jgi:hypothetical protein